MVTKYRARVRLERRLALALSIALVACFALPSRVSAQETPLKHFTKRGAYDDVRFDLHNAIIGRGLVVDFNGQVSKMLERTAADLGGTRTIYKQAEYFTFCSAKLSRLTMEADPLNLGFCPYVIFIYETTAAPGTIHVGYRPPQRHGSVQSRSALEAVEGLLDSIAKDAVK
jgi:hypothetical protein